MRAAADLLRNLRAQGVELRTDGEQLHVWGPAAVLTVPVYHQLQYYKPELIELLWAGSILGTVPPPRAQPAPPPIKAPQDGTSAKEARFPDGARAQVRPESPGHFAVWMLAGGRWKRRDGFSTPFADHACRTAEQWLGTPVDGWHVLEGAES